MAESEIRDLLTQARYQQSIIDAISRPAERTLTWGRYAAIFLTETRVNQGADFWAENADTLAAAEAKFGVPAAVMVAILGVETSYGRIMGNYRVIDALATLAFDYPPRSAFFRSELAQFLLLVSEYPVEAENLMGSYAGAMGMAQFISSSYRHYAADSDGDGFVDLWSNPADAIFSIGNYLQMHGWQADDGVFFALPEADDSLESLVSSGLEPDISFAQLEQSAPEAVEAAGILLDDQELVSLMRLQTEDAVEYWVGQRNFYVITRYNHSHLYAMAVASLAQQIEAAYLK